MVVGIKPRPLRSWGGLIIVGLISPVAASSADASSVLVDRSPVGNFSGSWLDMAAFQNFLVPVTLGSAAKIEEFDIYTPGSLAPFGASVTLRVRSDVGGMPAGTNLFELNSTLSYVSGSGVATLAGASFTPFDLAAGTYWVGLSGTSQELDWSSFAGLPNDSWQLSGENVQGRPVIGGLAFRVLGTNGAVPEPASWALMLGGFGLVGSAMRRKREAVQIA